VIIILDKINNFKGNSICFVNQDKFILYNTAEKLKKYININDVFEIIPKDGNIKIQDIREMQDFLLYKPNFSPYKLIFIHEIDKMTQQAANASLKILEEPPVFSIIIGTTSRWYKKAKKLLNFVKGFPSTETNTLIKYLMNENADVESTILKHEAFFELIKRFEKLNLIEIQNIIDKILLYKNKLDDKLKTIKTLSKLFLAVYHDAFIYALSTYWKEFYSLNMVYFFGLADFELDFQQIYENVQWCEKTMKANVSNFNFDLTIQTMFLRFIHAFFKNKED